MSTKKPRITETKISIPDGISVDLNDTELAIKGPLGTNTKSFLRIPVSLSVGDDDIIIKATGNRKFHLSIMITARSLIKNMIKGATNGFSYRLKMVYAHFPMSVKVSGDKLLIENFYGERSPRVARIMGECKLKTDGDDVVIDGISLEDVGQTAANIERATKVKKKDQRVFLDGIYVYEKKKE
ncbi:MAG: 50S ribosomal protein L6 [Nitrososphaerales archaeon]